ncbi:MAG: hypothetical protein ABI688_00180 [Bacteroidota bacterium]
MEVHAHTHTARKKWTHYFWEFLMLFLAVFCGFLAEYQLEHKIEHDRERAYMKGIVENLKYDIIRCTINAKLNMENGLGLDSFRTELKNAIAGQVNANALYYYYLRYSELNEAAFNISTISELKNSGSLRLIRNKKIVADLADYYERKIYAARDYYPSKDQQDALQKTKNQFFSMVALDDYVNSYNSINETNYTNNYNYQDLLTHQPALQLLTTNSKDLEILFTQLSQFEIKVKQYNFWLSQCKKAAEKLIADIQEAYHLSEGTPLEK